MADGGPSAETVFTMATAVVNLVIALVTGRQEIRRQRRSNDVVQSVRDNGDKTIATIRRESDQLSERVADLSSAITRELTSFNDRFKASQDQLTLLLRRMTTKGGNP